MARVTRCDLCGGIYENRSDGTVMSIGCYRSDEENHSVELCQDCTVKLGISLKEISPFKQFHMTLNFLRRMTHLVQARQEATRRGE